MNPYEKTTEEMKRQAEGPKRFAKAAINVGSALGAASFIPMLSRAAPFLSQYIPENLAIKGLTKISPKFGKFVQEAIDGGYDFQQVKDFIGDQIKQSGKAKENGNIIQQHSPELHDFIETEIKRGRTPLQMAAVTQGMSKFADVIKKIAKQNKVSWQEVVESIYGSAAAPAQQGQPQQQAQPIQQQAAAQAPQPQQGQSAPQGQQGPGNQALMSILQKIQQARGGGAP